MVSAFSAWASPGRLSPLGSDVELLHLCHHCTSEDNRLVDELFSAMYRISGKLLGALVYPGTRSNCRCNTEGATDTLRSNCIAAFQCRRVQAT